MLIFELILTDKPKCPKQSQPEKIIVANHRDQHIDENDQSKTNTHKKVNV